jgi:predicted  nucleic acid-binding Zn-ribbon protein
LRAARGHNEADIEDTEKQEDPKMATITVTTTTKTEDLRLEYERANRRVVELATEARDLPGRIEEAARADAKARAQAARSREDVSVVTSSVVTSSALVGLREREASLPLELWAGRVARLEASIALRRAEAQEIGRLAEEARAVCEAAEQRLKEAQQEHDAARDRHWSLATRAQNLRNQVGQESRELAELEESPPA